MNTKNTNISPALQEYTWRPANREDAPLIYQLMQAVQPYDHLPWNLSLEDVYREFDAEEFNPAEDSRLILTPEGEPAALAWINVPNQEEGDRYYAFLSGDVHPQHRGRGLGTAILQWMEQRAARKLSALPGNRPRLLRFGCMDFMADRIALAQAHGYRPLRYFYSMRRDLGQPIPDLPLPDGLSLRLYSSDMDDALMDAFNAAFQDHFGFFPIRPQAWKLWVTGNPDFKPEFTFLVMDGDQIAAFSINQVRSLREYHAGGEATINQGWIQDLGTLRQWRKHGIASALLCLSLKIFKEAGYQYAGLGVDTENTTGALRIYEKVGFKPKMTSIAFAKYLENQK